jgi:prepilin-type N-terminal cleavage/methylation domain-containing protein
MNTRAKPSQHSGEHGLTLTEMLMVITILGLIAAGIGTAFITSMRATQRVSTIVPGVQATQGLDSWLKSDIESATPTGVATWIADSSSSGTGTGCSSLSPAEPGGTLNVLHIETKDPTGRALAPNDLFAASYRYRPDGTLWRAWCVKGGASIAHNELVAGLKAKPIATYDATTKKISISATTRNKAVDYSFSLVGAVRTTATTTTPVFSPTTTKAPHDPCRYTAATVTGYDPLLAVVPITKQATGNSPGFLGDRVSGKRFTLGFTVTATGNCSNPLQVDPITGLADPEGLAVRITIPASPGPDVIETTPLTMDPAVAGAWRNVSPYYLSLSGAWRRTDYPIVVLDGYDPLDIVNSPGYPINGPAVPPALPYQVSVAAS